MDHTVPCQPDIRDPQPFHFERSADDNINTKNNTIIYGMMEKKMEASTIGFSLIPLHRPQSATPSVQWVRC